MRIMVVEDEVLIAMHLESMIVEAGHEVSWLAADRAEAVRGATEQQPDLATMDLRLASGESGADVAAALKETFGLRCLFISGNLDRERMERLQPLEPLGFLHKPVAPRALQAALAAAADVLAATSSPEVFVPTGAAAAREDQ